MGWRSFYFGNDPEQHAKFRESSLGCEAGDDHGGAGEDGAAAAGPPDWHSADASARGWYGLGEETKQHEMQNWQAADASARGWYGLQTKDEGWNPPPEAIEAAKAAGMVYLPQSRASGT